MRMIGRNEACLCGSGKKFKKCCIEIKLASEVSARQRSMEDLKERAKRRVSEHGLEEPIYLQDPKGIKKMSEVILEFAAPFLKEADSFHDYKKVITLAVVAWNLSLFDEADRSDNMKSLVKEVFRSKERAVASEFQTILSAFVQRKLKVFPDIKRFIMDWEVIETDGHFHLNVASTLMEGDREIKQFEKRAAEAMTSQSNF